ncbi:MAG: flagellar basal body-associated FliL family protein [Desulfovibrionaceae bacterium]|nr:flagellar basal body-associated FliL family protein [Desulfovibrionaceae bacterium]MBF0513867.1 flagellar basal body-associated FliL family protein [Desulfovibrionaceae bacterium]
MNRTEATSPRSAWIAATLLAAVLLAAALPIASRAPAFAAEGHGEGGGEGGEKKEEGKDKNKLPKNVLEFQSLTVNLAEPRSFARLSFLIEFKTPEDTENFNMPKARDAVIFLLSRKRGEDLWTGKDKNGLKWEIISRFNDFLGERKVVKIYYTEFIIH